MIKKENFLLYAEQTTIHIERRTTFLNNRSNGKIKAGIRILSMLSDQIVFFKIVIPMPFNAKFKIHFVWLMRKNLLWTTYDFLVGIFYISILLSDNITRIAICTFSSRIKVGFVSQGNHVIRVEQVLPFGKDQHH